jgi:hypothetical protein
LALEIKTEILPKRQKMKKRKLKKEKRQMKTRRTRPPTMETRKGAYSTMACFRPLLRPT